MVNSLAASYRRLSLARKLTVATLLTSTVTPLIACGFLAVYDYSASRARTMQELTVLADVVGADATAPLAFNDQKASADPLPALAANRHIIRARLFTNDGVQLANYERIGVHQDDGQSGSRFAPSTFFNSGTLRVVRPILLDGHPVGTITLESDLTDTTARLGRFASIVALVALATFGIAFWLSRITGRLAYAPIGHLIAATRLVRE